MQLIRDICRGDGCGLLRPIVNKRYYLCDECNFKRTHNGQSKEEVYSARAAQRAKVAPVKQTSKKPNEELLGAKVTKASKLNPVSSSKRYRCSNGELVSEAEIKWKYSLTCDKIKQTRPPVCQGQGRGDVPLSFSHTISRARCKELGKTELIWDEDNIEIEGFHEPSSKPHYAHNIWETGSIDQKVCLLNFERKLEFIERHDPEEYRRLVIKMEEFLK